MIRAVWVALFCGLHLGCGGYNSYPAYPGYGYGQGYPVPAHGYGYAPYPGPAYGYYPGPNYYGRPYGGYGYGYGGNHNYHPPVSDQQKALNFVYDHRRQIQRLPPQQQQEILRGVNRMINNPPQNQSHQKHKP